MNFVPLLAPLKIANLYTYIGSMAPNQFVLEYWIAFEDGSRPDACIFIYGM